MSRVCSGQDICVLSTQFAPSVVRREALIFRRPADRRFFKSSRLVHPGLPGPPGSGHHRLLIAHHEPDVLKGRHMELRDLDPAREAPSNIVGRCALRVRLLRGAWPAKKSEAARKLYGRETSFRSSAHIKSSEAAANLILWHARSENGPFFTVYGGFWTAPSHVSVQYIIYLAGTAEKSC